MKKSKANLFLVGILVSGIIFSTIFFFVSKYLIKIIFSKPGEIFFPSSFLIMLSAVLGIEIIIFLMCFMKKFSLKVWNIFRHEHEAKEKNSDFGQYQKIIFIVITIPCLFFIFIFSISSLGYIKVSENHIFYRDLFTSKIEKVYDFNSVYLIPDEHNSNDLRISFDGKFPAGDFFNQDKLIQIIKSKQTDEAVKSTISQNQSVKKKGGFSAFWTYLIVLGLIFIISFLSQKKNKNNKEK